MSSRAAAIERDLADILAPLRAQFSIPHDAIYLDGNSLGALPIAASERVRHTIEAEWGTGLVSSWNSAGWMQLSVIIADKIAELIGAGRGDVAVGDSTSVNLFKVLSAAATLSAAQGDGGVILSEIDNFPTDLYIAEGVARTHGLRLELTNADHIATRLGDRTSERVAMVMLTHVNYRTGVMHDMAQVTATAHAAGALMVWDLAHSAGAVEVDVTAAGADFAVGCGYKYLNGGPGAPAFLWVHPQLIDASVQPLSGWMGHSAPFEFAPNYAPATGIAKFLCGTPNVLSLAALDTGVDTVLAASEFGGMTALRAKSLALSDLFIELAEPIAREHSMTIVTPSEPARRGSHVSLARAEGGYAIVQALIERGVIGDFRAPDILRFGLTPLYTRFVDVHDACEHLAEVMASGEWRNKRFNRRLGVT